MTTQARLLVGEKLSWDCWRCNVLCWVAVDCSPGFILDLDTRLLTAGGGAALVPDEVSITLLPEVVAAEGWGVVESSEPGGSGVNPDQNTHTKSSPLVKSITRIYLNICV